MGVEIADLGAARLVSVKRRRLTRKASLPVQFAGLTPHAGTEHWAAPEVWFEGDYGYPGDIWSFGTIVFELLTLEMFTPGPGPAELLACALSRLDCQVEAESHLLGPLQPPMVKAAGLRRHRLPFVGSMRGFCATAGPVGSGRCSIEVVP